MKKIMRGVLNSSMGYLPFKIIEGIFGIISIRLYTHLITTEDYGIYGTVNITMMVIYLLTLGWFMFVAIRYVKDQKTVEEKKSFYTNQLLMQGMTLLVLILIYMGASGFISSRYGFNSRMILIIGLFFMGYGSTQFYTHLLLYLDRRALNIYLVVGSAVLKPILVYGLYKGGIDTLYILFLGHGLVDLLMGLIAFLTIRPFRYFDRSYIDFRKFKEFFSYGFPLIGLTLTMFVLNMSDRYIIEGFFSNHEVGLYIASYSVVSAAFPMISYGLTRGFYPRLLGAWKDGDMETSSQILSGGIKNFLFIALPAATGMSLVSNEIGHMIIDPKFMEGYPVISYVAMGMFFLGLTEYMNKDWELTGNTKPIFYHSLIAAVFNVILNLIFVPIYGFIAAAMTTAGSFVLYFIISLLRREGKIPLKLVPREIIGILISNLLMAGGLVFIDQLEIGTALMLMTKILGGVGIYGLSILVFKVYDIRAWLNQHR